MINSGGNDDFDEINTFSKDNIEEQKAIYEQIQRDNQQKLKEDQNDQNHV